jgi:hypothetical protein
MDLKAPAAHPHAALHHGIASIALGGALLLLTVPTMQLAFILQASDYPGWSRDDKELAAYGGYFGGGLVEILCFAGVVIGVKGATAANRTGEPGVLCASGVALCLFTAAVWVMVIVAWHSQAYRFVR